MTAEVFAARLRELRRAAGLTQRQLADRAGMTEAGIRNLEQGRTKPVWASVIALADALAVATDTFRQASSTAQPAPKRGRPRKGEGQEVKPTTGQPGNAS